MASTVFPVASAGGGILSVQRGSAGAAGSVTITSVNIAKSFVTVFGSASSGTVSASFNMNQNAGNFNLLGTGDWDRSASNNNSSYRVRPTNSTSNEGGTYSAGGGSIKFWNKTTAMNAGNTTIGAGSNNLVSAVVTGFLANSTTLTVSGACRYEVVEFA